MKLNKRKGFTIVELVIVIAVIAILAAVLIPNISNLVKKANASADESLVRNLNTALSMDVEKHQTMDAALEAALKNGGYELTTIVTKNKDNKILWDSKNDCFVYLNGKTIKYLPNTQTEKNVEDVDYFEIVELKDGKVPDSKYSAYLAGETVLGTVEVERGLDVGKNTVAEVVFKTNEKVSVLINTNGGKLTVNAGSANVTHRGDASIITIEAVAKESYHENGKVNEIKLKDGRVVVEAKAEVGSILVTAEEANKGKVKIDVMDSATLGAIGAEKFNIKATTDIITGADKTEVVEGATGESAFAGGFGTEKAPYLIDNSNQWSSFIDKASNGNYWKVISDLDFSKVTNATVPTFNGTIDFDNHTIKGVQKSSLHYSFLFDDVKNATIKNLNFYDVALIYNTYGKVLLKNINAYGELLVDDNNTTPFVFYAGNGQLEFNNCDNYMLVSSVGGSCAALYVGTLGNYLDEVKFIDCDNYGDLIHSAGYSSMLISNGGSCLTAQEAGGKNYYGKPLENIIVVNNCHNYGKIAGIENVALVIGHTKYTQLQYDTLVDHGGLVKLTPVKITENENKLELVSVTGAVKYRVMYTFWDQIFIEGKDVEHGSSNRGYSFTTDNLENVTLFNYKFVNYVDGMEKTEYSVADGKIYTTTVNGKTYYVYNPNGDKGTQDNTKDLMYTIAKQPFLTVLAYDEQGNVIGVAVYQYSDTKVPASN